MNAKTIFWLLWVSFFGGLIGTVMITKAYFAALLAVILDSNVGMQAAIYRVSITNPIFTGTQFTGRGIIVYDVGQG